MNGLIYQIQRFVIDKSTAFQTICQIIKCYQTRLFPNHVSSIYGYMGYKGIKGLSKYRPILGVLHTEMNVSHNETGGIGAGYIRDTKPFLLVYNKPYIGGYEHMMV